MGLQNRDVGADEISEGEEGAGSHGIGGETQARTLLGHQR